LTANHLTMNRLFGNAASRKPKPTLQDAIAAVSRFNADIPCMLNELD
jgi:hypothetical protein